VSSLRDTLKDLGRSLREPPDEILLDVGAGGELLVARLRVAVGLLLLSLPLLNLASGGTRHEVLSGLVGASLCLAASLVWLRLAKRKRRYAWLPMVSTAFDVSLVSLVLLLLALDTPTAGLNSSVVWCCYLLAIFVTALRHDVRVTLFAGGLAMVQFASLWLLVSTTNDAPLVSAAYGTVTSASQLQRLVLLGSVTLITILAVYRAQSLTRLSGTDRLTGLPNRSYLNTHVNEQVQAAHDAGRSLTLALVDLDRFSHINAELGHLAGDRALRHAVNTLRAGLGPDETMIRLGGVELVLVLPLPLGAAWERVDSLRRALNAQPFLPEPGVEPRKLTLSAGLACCPNDATDLSGLMKRADRRLIDAKANGRNRVVARDGG
jgi:diguanylate cyclase (GGDEF)-like protein